MDNTPSAMDAFASIPQAPVKRRGRPRKLPPPEPVAPPSPVAASLPAAQVQPPAPSLALNDVLQITSQQHPHYGSIFIVGDIKPPLVHGFFALGQGEKRFITAEDGQYARVGRAFVSARIACSQEWMEKHKPT